MPDISKLGPFICKLDRLYLYFIPDNLGSNFCKIAKFFFTFAPNAKKSSYAKSKSSDRKQQSLQQLPVLFSASTK